MTGDTSGILFETTNSHSLRDLLGFRIAVQRKECREVGGLLPDVNFRRMALLAVFEAKDFVWIHVHFCARISWVCFAGRWGGSPETG